jgi:hypothetical protein
MAAASDLLVFDSLHALGRAIREVRTAPAQELPAHLRPLQRHLDRARRIQHG